MWDKDVAQSSDRLFSPMAQINSQKCLVFFLQCVACAWGGRSEVQAFSFSYFYQQPNCVRLLSLGECYDNNAAGWKCIGRGACGVWAFLRPSGSRHFHRNRSNWPSVNWALSGQFASRVQTWTYTFTLDTAAPDSDPSPTSEFLRMPSFPVAGRLALINFRLVSEMSRFGRALGPSKL